MTVTRRAVLKSLFAAGGCALVGSSTYGYAYERHALGLTRVVLPVAGLPPALAGLKVGFLTDVHRGRWVPAEDVIEGVHALMSAAPDLIVLGGDYVTWGDRAFVSPSAEALAGLSAPYGVFAILGNHDDEIGRASCRERV